MGRCTLKNTQHERATEMSRNKEDRNPENIPVNQSSSAPPGRCREKMRAESPGHSEGQQRALSRRLPPYNEASGTSLGPVPWRPEPRPWAATSASWEGGCIS